MIRLTRLNQIPLVLNSDLIEQIEMTPDTLISLTNGQKFMVRESSDQIIQRIIDFRRLLLRGVPADDCPAMLSMDSPSNRPGRVAADGD